VAGIGSHPGHEDAGGCLTHRKARRRALKTRPEESGRRRPGVCATPVARKLLLPVFDTLQCKVSATY
jgi:hypothetical protein